MKPLKTIIAATALATLAVTVGVGFTIDDENIVDKNSIEFKLEEKIGPHTDTYKNAPEDTKTAIEATLNLYQRRLNGDEPTKEEWLEAEAAVDQLRKFADSDEFLRSVMQLHL